MIDLTGFLLARIAEDEAWADDCQNWSECGSGAWEGTGETYGCPAHPSTSRRIAECNAKRLIVDWHRPRSSGADYHSLCRECEWSYGDHDGMPNVWCRTIKTLAAPYADHADYCDEWKP